MKFELVVALVLSSAAVACGNSSNGTGGSGGTGSTSTSSKTSSTSKGVTSTSVGTGTGGAGGAMEDGTSGKQCATDADCDVTGAGTAKCTKTPLYGQMGQPASTFFPTSICVQTSVCDPGAGTSVMGCDNNAGICLDTGTPGQGVCLPFCQFDSTGAKYTGNCPGTDACNAYGFGKDMNNAPFGVGYCFGGCLKDADCTASGEKCDVYDGLCKAASLVTVPTKNVGDSCTGSTDTACNCGKATSATVGMCVQFCKYGDANNTCPTGTYCDADIPTTLTTPFTKVPAGIAGSCLKTCTQASDCPTMQCYASAGETQMTCHFAAP